MITKILSWTNFKTTVDAKGGKAFIQWFLESERYTLFFIEGQLAVECVFDQDSTDGLDFENNYKAAANNKMQEIDETGRAVTRFAATKKGWHYQAHSVSFEVGKKDSLYNKDSNGSDLGFSTIEFHDGLDLATATDISDQSQAFLDANAKKTIVKWCPSYDFEVVSGSIRQISKKSSDLFMYVNAKIPTGYPAPNDWLRVPFVEGGVNLNYIGADEPLKTDGRAAKLFKGSEGEHFEVIVNHDTLEKHKITVVFEIYKSPLS